LLSSSLTARFQISTYPLPPPPTPPHPPPLPRSRMISRIQGCLICLCPTSFSSSLSPFSLPPPPPPSVFLSAHSVLRPFLSISVTLFDSSLPKALSLSSSNANAFSQAVCFYPALRSGRAGPVRVTCTRIPAPPGLPGLGRARWAAGQARGCSAVTWKWKR
jgi:hypothetical protein